MGEEPFFWAVPFAAVLARPQAERPGVLRPWARRTLPHMKFAFLLAGGTLAWLIDEPVAWAVASLFVAVPLGVVIVGFGGR